MTTRQCPSGTVRRGLASRVVSRTIAPCLMIACQDGDTLGTTPDTGAPTSETGALPTDERPPFLEMITRVTFTFYDMEANVTESSWTDPDADGAGSADPIVLQEGSYAVLVALWNDLQSPPVDVNNEIGVEEKLHQAFLPSAHVQGTMFPYTATGLLTYQYGDLDDDGLPIGLAYGVDANAAGTGSFRFVLQHLAGADGVSLKEPDLVDRVETDGVTALPGYTDLDIEFPLVVE